MLLYFLPSWQTNGHYFHFWTEVYEALFCFPALRRLSQILFRPFRSVGSLVTNKDVTSQKQILDLRFAWPFLAYLFLFVGVLVLNYGLPLLDIRWSRSVFEGEGLMVGWNLYNGLLMFICLLACIDKPVRRQADRFPLELAACLELGGKEYWGTTNDVSEQGASLVLNTAAPTGTETEGLLRVPPVPPGTAGAPDAHGPPPPAAAAGAQLPDAGPGDGGRPDPADLRGKRLVPEGDAGGQRRGAVPAPGQRGAGRADRAALLTCRPGRRYIGNRRFSPRMAGC